ncbi:MAG TPA: glycoside hydrolase family 76 protein [Fibrella sp.]
MTSPVLTRLNYDPQRQPDPYVPGTGRPDNWVLRCYSSVYVPDKLTSLFLMVSLLFACHKSVGQRAESALKPYTFNWTRIADSSSNALDTQFFNKEGRYYNASSIGSTKFNYWPQAHALDVLVDAYTRTKDSRYLAHMNDWFLGVPVKNGNTFLNTYYDDMLWNALAMLRAFDATKDKKWLDATLALWEDIKLGWSDEQGGGIAWQKKQLSYKNTPANAPAVILAARLYQRLNNRSADLEWAKKIYAWQLKTLVDPATGFVYDGINRQNDGKIDTGWKFTYNQGLMIGAGLELFRATKIDTYLKDAMKTANFTIADPVLAPSGLLKAEGNGDGGLFKAVLVRYLALLATEPAVPADIRTRYVGFLTTNAETLWRSGTQKPAVVFGPNWASQPADGKAELTTQLSGATLLEAMTRLK